LLRLLQSTSADNFLHIHQSIQHTARPSLGTPLTKGLPIEPVAKVNCMCAPPVSSPPSKGTQKLGGRSTQLTPSSVHTQRITSTWQAKVTTIRALNILSKGTLFMSQFERCDVHGTAGAPFFRTACRPAPEGRHTRKPRLTYVLQLRWLPSSTARLSSSAIWWLQPRSSGGYHHTSSPHINS